MFAIKIGSGPAQLVKNTEQMGARLSGIYCTEEFIKGILQEAYFMAPGNIIFYPSLDVPLQIACYDSEKQSIHEQKGKLRIISLQDTANMLKIHDDIGDFTVNQPETAGTYDNLNIRKIPYKGTNGIRMSHMAYVHDKHAPNRAYVVKKRENGEDRMLVTRRFLPSKAAYIYDIPKAVHFENESEETTLERALDRAQGHFTIKDISRSFTVLTEPEATDSQVTIVDCLVEPTGDAQSIYEGEIGYVEYVWLSVDGLKEFCRKSREYSEVMQTPHYVSALAALTAAAMLEKLS